MFYSQFILAKKGPLGTIWIAAHLERKLRKNQVADTDIGVSVDSILFPEVPIALRLSSHLLLGVVRIYSRKVNYLFHDCSEALLKVKQAFRSTAVDLPPEESTAPYHSITLPETFDLDDFELPDSEHFQGNYVDHHVSTREQITLQDTMDGVVYSTSQFGLDERFGDGDTSQIGLDLDEELFLDKVTSPGQTSVLLDSQNVNPQASGPMTPFTEMDIDDDQTTVDEDRIGEVICTGSKGAKTVSTQDENIADDPSPLSGSEIQTSNINEHNFTIEPVGVASRSPTTESIQCAPCTGHVNEDPSCGFVKNSCGEVLQEDQKSVGRENPGNLYNKDINKAVDCALLNSKSCETDLLDKANEEIHLDRQGKEKGDSSAVLAMNPTQFDVVHTVSSPTSVLAEQPKPTSPVLGLLDATVAIPDIIERTEVWQNGVICSEKPSSSNDTHAEDLAPIDVTMDTSPTLTLVGSCDKPSQSNDIPTPSEGISQSRCVSPGETPGPEALASDLPERCNPSDLFPPGAYSLLGLVSTHEPNGVESGADLGTKVTEIQHIVGSNKESFEHQHVLRACSSVLKQSEDVVSNGLEISFTGTKACSLSILELEEDVHASGVSALVQGEEGPTSIRETNIEPNKILESVPSNGVASNVEKLGEQSDTVVSKDSQSDRVASFNLPVPEPEMLLSVPASVPDAQNDLLVQLTPEKEVSEEGGNGLKNLSGRKRQLMESAPVQQYGSSTKLSGIPRSKRTVDSIPDDDDLLSSILVGRKSSALKLRPTPPPTEIAARKRPRITPRASVVKRKVLLDDTMVLHGDTIRQQLTSTEDIRRLRKKAPCTRPEIWVIQKHLLEDEIFNEPLFSGMSVDLIGLQNRIFDVTEFRDSGMNVDCPVSEVPGEVMWSSGTSLIGEANTEGLDEPVAASGGEANESTATIVLVDSQLCEEHLSDCIDFGTQQLTRPLTDISPNDLQKGQADISSPMEIDDGSVVANTMDHTDNTVSEDRCNQTLCSEIKSLLVEKSNGVQTILPNDGNLDTQSVEKDAFIIQRCNYRDDALNGAEVNMEGLHLDEGVPMENDRSAQEISESSSVKVMLQDMPQVVDACDVCLSPKNTMLEKCSGDNRADVPEDASATPTFVTDCHFKEGIRSESEYVTRDENVVDVAGNSSSTFMCIEDPQRDFSCQSEFNITTETVPFDEFENQGSRDADLAGNPSRLSADLGGTMAAETTSLYNTSLETPCDLGNTLDGNDTGFLNFDDEDTIEEDNGIPNAEEVGILDNSGWSSRTRGVAKYLQTLFDTESGHGRKVLSMDNLLSGKTRKEASRMFFETLVLKTRDYIHVEQENAFDIISIKPRVKLVKSDF